MKDIISKAEDPEPARAESPKIFLDLFTEVSGMTLNGKDSEPEPSLVAKSKDVYAILIFGSCTDESSTPKDLDICFVLTEEVDDPVQEYASSLGKMFDLAYSMQTKTQEWGRLDINRGFIESHNHIYPRLRQEISQADNILIFAFDEKSAVKVAEELQKIKRG